MLTGLPTQVLHVPLYLPNNGELRCHGHKVSLTQRICFWLAFNGSIFWSAYCVQYFGLGIVEERRAGRASTTKAFPDSRDKTCTHIVGIKHSEC